VHICSRRQQSKRENKVESYESGSDSGICVHG
jgi:hypothetical protein